MESPPNQTQLLNPDEFLSFSREHAFQLYSTFCGDFERTAAALNVRPIDIMRVAEEENWGEKLQTVIKLKKSTKPGDLERAINCALNFTQAHRLRLFLERQLQRLANMKSEELGEYLQQRDVTVNKDGSQKTSRKLNMRPLTDLASAIEKAQQMSYSALHDTATDRQKRAEEPDGDVSAGEI